MRELLLYDASRRPPNWSDCLLPTEYAVFHLDRINESFRNPQCTEANEPRCLVFDNLAKAEQYCIALVEERPELRCEVFTWRGRADDPVRTFVNPRFLKTPEAVRFRRWIVAAAWISAGFLCLLIDQHYGWTLALPTAVALKFFLIALIPILWNLADILEAKRRRREDPSMTKLDISSHGVIGVIKDSSPTTKGAGTRMLDLVP